MKNKLSKIIMFMGFVFLEMGFVSVAIFGVIGGIVLFVIGGILISAGIFLKHEKKDNEHYEYVEENLELSSKDTQTKCEYCGSVYDKNSSSCPTCGAKKK